MADLTDKVAIITGGSTGLGRATAEGLAGAGAAVAVAAIDQGSLNECVAAIRAAGGRAYGVVTDVRDESSVQAMAAQVTAEFGGIDILVNNAAIYPRRAWTEIKTQEWDDVFATNIRGYFLCARAVHASMVSRGGGRIINISSITFFTGMTHLLDYVSTKGSVIGFTRSLARELGPEGITVNCIAPGAFPTAAEEIHPDREALVAYFLEQQSVKRRGRPDDIAHAVTFLADPRSDFITGQTLMVDGGWHMH